MFHWFGAREDGQDPHDEELHPLCDGLNYLFEIYLEPGTRRGSMATPDRVCTLARLANRVVRMKVILLRFVAFFAREEAYHPEALIGGYAMSARAYDM